MQPDNNPQDQMPVNPNDIQDDDVLPADGPSEAGRNHPAGDSNIDSHEAYDAGLDESSGLRQ